MQKSTRLFKCLMIIFVIIFIIGTYIDAKRNNPCPPGQLLNPDYEITPWVALKLLIIMVIAWHKIGNGFILFTIELVVLAAIFQGLGLGIILNLNDINIAALGLVGFALVAVSGFKNLFK